MSTRLQALQAPLRVRYVCNPPFDYQNVECLVVEQCDLPIADSFIQSLEIIPLS